MRTMRTMLMLVAVSVAGTMAGPLISYQAHSYNDLSLWPQVLQKGAAWSPDSLWFKIDPHYAPPAFCATQPQVSAPWARTDGCFLLNHNDLSAARAYNSSDDVLALLRDPANAAWFGAAAAKPVTIAWCFKVDAMGVCDASPQAAAFRAAFRALFDALVALQLDPAFSVSFVLDGSGVPSRGAECMAQYGNASSLILPGTWAFDFSKSVPYEAAFSDNATLNYNRLTVFDTPVPTPAFDLMALLGYGKFPASGHPLLVWEPSVQAGILDVAATYARHGPHAAPGLRFAINIDPLQFLLYAAPVAGRAWNVLALERAAPTFALVARPASAAAPLVLASLYVNATDARVYVAAWAAPAGARGGADELKALGVPAPAEAATGVVAVTVPPAGNGSFVAWIGRGGRGVDGVLSADGTVAWAADGRQVVELGPGCEVVAVSPVAETAAAVCASAPDTIVVAGGGVSASVAVPAGVGELEAGVGSVVAVGSDVVVVVASTAKVVYAGFAGGKLTKIGVGSGPRVAGCVGAGCDSDGLAGGMLSVVHTDGWCWNSETHNKATTPSTCAFEPEPTPNVLEYAFVPPAGLKAFVAQTVAQRAEITTDVLSPCLAGLGLVAGSYGSGRGPAAIVIAPADGAPTMLELHTALAPNTPDVGECGLPDYAPSPVPAMMLSAFPTPVPAAAA